MAVITRYIVVRNGIEHDQVFEIKKEADAFDKMLEASENLTAFIKQSDLEVKLDDKTIQAVSMVLAKNGPHVSKILRNVKPYVPPTPRPEPTPKTKKVAEKSSTQRKAKK